MHRSIIAIFGLVALAACQSTTSGAKGIVADPGVSEVPVASPLMDTAPTTAVADVDFGELLNGLRIDNGLTMVTYDARLDAAAQKHAQDMLDNNYFSHDSLDGRTFSDRIAAEGYVAAYEGENILKGQQNNQDALDAWLLSKNHRELMLDESLPNQVAEDFALGVAGQGRDTRWVLLMAREQ
ncbi:MAG: CAP domain-containing protein [Yoonia sp.]|uniref:CAP domain-containing protein n=1 Tax=Yoonia sp. TaxID=2212373 RepID=UPI00326683CC